MSKPIIHLDRLAKRYNKSDVNALDDISFEVEEGQFFTLLGPNGAGKTTLISILTTTLSPTGGTATIDGNDLVREAAEIRQKVGIIFQKPSLDQNLTAEENVRFHAMMYGLYPFRPSYASMPDAYRKQVRELAEVLGLKDEMFKPIKTFSGGMKRKLEIIRSLIHKPKILFLDEPTTGLDPISRRDLWEYLTEVRAKQGTTVFLTTHYLEEAEGADTVCIINKGKIVSYGTPEGIKAELVKEYLIVDAADRTALTAELKHLQLDYVVGDTIQVILGKYSAYELVTTLKTPLTVMRTHTPTLEDAYLKIIEEKDESLESIGLTMEARS